jgi:hypothetical protein
LNLVGFGDADSSVERLGLLPMTSTLLDMLDGAKGTAKEKVGVCLAAAAAGFLVDGQRQLRVVGSFSTPLVGEVDGGENS